MHHFLGKWVDGGGSKLSGGGLDVARESAGTYRVKAPTGTAGVGEISSVNVTIEPPFSEEVTLTIVGVCSVHGLWCRGESDGCGPVKDAGIPVRRFGAYVDDLDAAAGTFKVKIHALPKCATTEEAKAAQPPAPTDASFAVLVVARRAAWA